MLGTTDSATGGAAGPEADKGASRGDAATAALDIIDYGEHIDYRDGRTSWPIRIRPRIGRHSYSANTWRGRCDSAAGLS
jgi:hypothetical protein